MIADNKNTSTEKSNTISFTDAELLMQNLVGKEIFISCGYGGVLFLEIGNITEHEHEYQEGLFTTRKIGNYRLFSDEDWKYTDSEKNIERWGCDSSAKTDENFKKVGICVIEKIVITDTFEQTTFILSGNKSITIFKDDSLDTFHLILISEEKKLTVYGNGRCEYKDYQEDKFWLKQAKPRQKQSQTVTFDRSVFRQYCPDLSPLSVTKAMEYAHNLLGQKVENIKVESATRFSINIGPSYRNNLSEKDKKLWTREIPRWSIRIDEIWSLKKDGVVLLDVKKEKFHFAEKLKQELIEKRIIAITFDHKGKAAQFEFTEGYLLELQDSGRFSRWDIHDFLTGFTMSSYEKDGLQYRISAPIHLQDKYDTGDIHLDAMLYQLDFYKNYFSQDTNSNEK